MSSIKDVLARKLSKQQSEDIAAPPVQLDWYGNAESWKPSATCSLGDLIDGIRLGDFADKVAEVRALLSAGDKDGADALKKTLPAVSISGSIREGRRKGAADEGRFDHSGLLQIDLDGKDNPGLTVDEMRAMLMADPHVVAGFVTPSGAGIKGIASIPRDVHGHKAAFLVAEQHFAALGLAIDKSVKDPVRLCFVSHDPQAWLREGPAEEFVPQLTIAETLDDDEEVDSRPQERPQRAAANFTATDGRIVIRGGDMPAGGEITTDDVRGMLSRIPTRPPYSEWLRIASAVWDAIGEVEGTSALLAWSPEERPGEYAGKFKARLQDVKTGTLVMLAKDHGWHAPAMVSTVVAKAQSITTSAAVPVKRDKNAIPEDVFPVPAGDIGHDLASRHIFTVVGPKKRLFMRGTTVHEVASEAGGHFSLTPVTAERFASMIETFGARVMRREPREDGTMRWRSTTFPVSSAKIALASDGARDCLPTIRQLVSAPVIIRDEQKTATLTQGWHPHAGGTFVTSRREVKMVGIDEAKEIIAELIADFDFPDAGDLSRAIASFISPAMKIGGWIDDDFPLDVAEADQSQAGKTYRHKVVCAMYRETPSTITQSTGGVGSLDERVAAALIAGRPFIAMDNFRGRMDSQTLESAIRGNGRVTARALRYSAEVDCSPFLWQLSTNGAELTRDLANRSIITRIRKKPAGHIFTTYPEGDLLAHVKANQPRFLGAVHSVIREWVRQGCQRTDESRHDFRVWCRTMDWIVQEIFGSAPLLNGHREEQMRTSNPKLQWLRDVVNAILTDGYDGHGLSASDLGDAAEHHDIPLPGRRANSVEALDVAIGKVLGRLYRDAEDEVLIVDGHRFIRQVVHEHDPLQRREWERKVYVIETPSVLN